MSYVASAAWKSAAAATSVMPVSWGSSSPPGNVFDTVTPVEDGGSSSTVSVPILTWHVVVIAAILRLWISRRRVLPGAAATPTVPAAPDAPLVLNWPMGYARPSARSCTPGLVVSPHTRMTSVECVVTDVNRWSVICWPATVEHGTTTRPSPSSTPENTPNAATNHGNGTAPVDFGSTPTQV